MNPARDPNSAPLDTESLHFLLSRQFDGDLTEAEASELAASPETSAGQIFYAAISDVRDRMKAIPVRPVAASFADSVLGEIGSQAKAVQVPPIGIASEMRRGWIARSIVAVSVAACVLIVFVALKPHSPGQQAISTHRPAPDTAMPIPISRADAESESAASMADADVAKVQESTEQQAELQPFLDSDDWQIVVVKVNSKDRETVMRDIEALVARQGMNLRSVVDSDNYDSRFGVLLTSVGIDEKEFVESVLSEGETRTADWDADSVATSSREDLIARMQESMKTPTHSELHFGQIYLALPKVAAVVEEALLAKADSARERQVAGGASVALADEAKDSARRNFSQSSKISTSPAEAGKSLGFRQNTGHRKPALVVFEFTEAATPGAVDGPI